MEFKSYVPRCMAFVRAMWISGLALLCAGWSAALLPTTDPREWRELLSQSQNMNAVYDDRLPEGSDRLSIDLDLSDDTQFNFLARRIKAAGKTEKNSPELFRKLEQLRSRAHERKRGGPSSGAAPSLDGSQGLWCDHYLTVNPPVPGPTPGTMVYEPYVRVSCKGGATYVFADIVAYDINETETESKRVAAEAGEEYGGGTDFIAVGAVAQVNVTDKHLLRLESVALAIDDVTGRDVSSYTVARTSIAFRQEGGFTLIHPREIVQNNQAEIKICQYRGWGRL